MNENELLKKWQDKFGLKDWLIYLIKVEQSDLKSLWKHNVNADNMYNEKTKISFIRYVRMSERTMIHELLHLVYPLESETKVEKRTIQTIKSLKKKYGT